MHLWALGSARFECFPITFLHLFVLSWLAQFVRLDSHTNSLSPSSVFIKFHLHSHHHCAMPRQTLIRPPEGGGAFHTCGSPGSRPSPSDIRILSQTLSILDQNQLAQCAVASHPSERKTTLLPFFLQKTSVDFTSH